MLESLDKFKYIMMAVLLVGVVVLLYRSFAHKRARKHSHKVVPKLPEQDTSLDMKKVSDNVAVPVTDTNTNTNADTDTTSTTQQDQAQTAQLSDKKEGLDNPFNAFGNFDSTNLPRSIWKVNEYRSRD